MKQQTYISPLLAASVYSKIQYLWGVAYLIFLIYAHFHHTTPEMIKNDITSLFVVWASGILVMECISILVVHTYFEEKFRHYSMFVCMCAAKDESAALNVMTMFNTQNVAELKEVKKAIVILAAISFGMMFTIAAGLAGISLLFA
ncbi:MAG: hypothetical protein ACRDCE_10490 [Cetobacterium sp.]|uniref:hypothetical protein n=1 Tax=Cetobacterium sp. TaxID=2071632 RepID=UPI003EE490B2